ncbi:type I-E CRISPR-associated protein Cse1/CasA [Nonomuraea sp. SYSU D8015]|uniref:type I-E CRISPR-associated protein Cse1/CasA n=1 Tax=Nonomuraea sp. SYSU D8015 TaxID=2593644 RepID=UPI00166075C2|nr:type I-E CRISPR-associated protein Cse1/CasA [Nonomuraea sp. SYSU D8015]
MNDERPRAVKPTSRYRRGARDDPEARAAHNEETRQWRRQQADAEFPPATRAQLLRDLTEGTSLADAVRRSKTRLSTSIVWGRARWDTEFSDTLEKALAANCAGGPRCGTDQGYKNGGRCKRCRAAHRGEPGTRQPEPPPAATTPGFGLVDEPWIEAYTVDGLKPVTVSLRQALTGAHELADLGYQDGTVNVAVQRLLVAIAHEALSAPGDDPRRWAAMWQAGQLPADELGAWLDEHAAAFDLFSRDRPFAQVPGLEVPADPRPISYLTAYAPQGAGAGFMFHPPSELTPAQAASWLLHCHAYDAGGIRTRAGGGREAGTPAGPLGYATQIRLVGSTLAHTLLHALIPGLGGGQTWWNRTQAPGRRKDQVPAVPADLLCWPSRGILLFRDPDGLVRSAHITAADDRPADAIDPYAGQAWTDPEDTLDAPPPRMLAPIFTSKSEPAPMVAALRQRVASQAVSPTEPIRMELVGIRYDKWRATIQDAGVWRSGKTTAAHLTPATMAGRAVSDAVADAGVALKLLRWAASEHIKRMPATRAERARIHANEAIRTAWMNAGRELALVLGPGVPRKPWEEHVYEMGDRVGEELSRRWQALDFKAAARIEQVGGLLRSKLRA